MGAKEAVVSVASVLNGVVGVLRAISWQTQDVPSVQRPHSKVSMG